MAYLLLDSNAITVFIRYELRQIFVLDLLYWQWVSLAACLLLCVNPWLVPARTLSWLRIRFHVLAQNRATAVLICALFPMVIRVALLPVIPIKPPSVHDEFSLLLMADTFHSGRLTNPTHRYWTHFETIHVIQKPTYASMYQAGAGILLAFGQVVHSPWIGVLLSVGLMCGAVCWMLQAWVPPAWAVCGALVAALQIGIGGYWMNSYFGGALPAAAGALLIGTIPRFLRRPTRTAAAIFAMSVVALVSTRPFEGVVLTILFVALAIVWHWKGVLGKPVIHWRIVLAPAVLILAAGGSFTAYYSWRVTGHATKIPYVVNRETYGWPENLAFLPPQKVAYRHEILKRMHEAELANREAYSSLGYMVESWIARAILIWEFFVGPAITLPLLMLPWTIRNPKARALFCIILVMWALNLTQLMAYPQHVAPQSSIFYLLLVGGMRQLYVLGRRSRILPERLMASLILCLACGAGLRLSGESLHFWMTFWERPYFPQRDARALIVSKLENMPGKHVVFVHYMSTHSPHEEWVYNAADIDSSKIVWANSMTQREDAELREYYHDRQAWVIEPDTDPTGFLPFWSRSRMRYGPVQ